MRARPSRSRWRRASRSAAQRDQALANLSFTTKCADLAGCDIIIETVVEDLDAKNAMWKELDARCGPATIFASNTSSLTIAAMAAATARADRMVGLHFFNPVPLMALVEVVKTVTTSAETFDTAFAFAERLGKQPIRAKDRSGFVVNLLLIPYLLDAVNALEAGVASVEDIDLGMQPFRLLDFVGLDTAYKIAEIMYAEYREKRMRRRRCSSGWCWRGCTGGSRGRGSMTTRRIRRG